MEGYLKIVEEIYNIAEGVNDQRIINLSKFLYQRINNPDSYLVFLGETCGGKSRLINSIIGKDILPVSGVPSTGSVVEVCFSEDDDEEYYAINKNATMEKINKSLFDELAIKPDGNLERLRYVTGASDVEINGVRIFDTPSYGSLLKEHEEVLTSFLPNADAVIYIVSYRVGFQEDDYEFLKDLLGFVRNGVPFYLFINRCPKGTLENDRRVMEIYNNVKILLQSENIPLSIIETFDDNSDCHKQILEVMEPIMRYLNGEARKAELKEAFAEYIRELIGYVKAELERRLRNIQMNEEQKRFQNESVLKCVTEIEKAVEKIVKPGFKEIYDTYPLKVMESKERINDEISLIIDESSKLSKDETTAYISRHVIKCKSQNEVSNLQFYIETELNAMDEELNDYLNKAIIDFEKDLELCNPSYSYKAGLRLIKGGGKKALDAGLLRYFAQYGGAGGSGAGVANAASHALKKVGDLFGKTFSRETHNSLKHVLKVLKLTSTKAISAAASGIIEAIAMIVDVNIWKSQLKKQVKKTTDKWADELESVVMVDLKKLEEENIDNIYYIINDAKQNYDTTESIGLNEEDYKNLEKYMNKINELERLVV